jgi:hypothetical protein
MHSTAHDNPSESFPTLSDQERDILSKFIAARDQFEQFSIASVKQSRYKFGSLALGWKDVTKEEVPFAVYAIPEKGYHLEIDIERRMKVAQAIPTSERSWKVGRTIRVWPKAVTEEFLSKIGEPQWKGLAYFAPITPKSEDL